jgi:hypothetical protein
MRKGFVCSLIDPITPKIRYVGITVGPWNKGVLATQEHKRKLGVPKPLEQKNIQNVLLNQNVKCGQKD